MLDKDPDSRSYFLAALLILLFLFLTIWAFYITGSVSPVTVNGMGKYNI